ncbi:MAG: hypothetical protein JNL42_13035 [Anaerolineae bacterium]|nr:hypothetical protein [Anaerolineae bacterium]
MSEYQYYEFHALDRPLTSEAQAEMHRLSSRVNLTATSASFAYNYGDFRGDPYLVLAEHFDAMLYITNWGMRQLMFRFPLHIIPDDVMKAYQVADSLEWSAEGEYVILNIELREEEPDYEWIEGEGLLAGLVQVRDDVLRGDYRALYLAWLMIASYELDFLEEEDEAEAALTEPEVPPNLQALSPALRNFINFFGIDADLVTAAAQTSPKAEKNSAKLSAYLDQLAAAEQRSFLERLLKSEPHLDVVLANRLRELSDAETGTLPAGERRTIRQLVTASQSVRQQRLDAERQEAEIIHMKKLGKIAQQQDRLWGQIPALINQKRANTYEEAVSILKDLRDLAAHQQRLAEFQEKLAAIRSQYPTLQGLHRRLKEARLT